MELIKGRVFDPPATYRGGRNLEKAYRSGFEAGIGAAAWDLAPAKYRNVFLKSVYERGFDAGRTAPMVAKPTGAIRP